MKKCEEKKEFKLRICREDGVYEVIDYTIPCFCVSIIFYMLMIICAFVTSDYGFIIGALLSPVIIGISFDAFTNFGLKKIDEN